MTANSNGTLNAELVIPFPSARHAEIAYNALRVDVEPSRGGTCKQLHLQENILKVCVTATEARKLRVSVNSFLDLLVLVTRTIDRFGPPK